MTGDHTQTLVAAFGLDSAPIEDGVAILSPPQSFAGGEDDYDEHIGGVAADVLRSGQGAWRLAQHLARRPIERVLELGAGGGACTLGLVEAADADVLVTDTSPAFLRMIRRKLASAEVKARIGYATLAGEELDRLPPASLDLIVVASAVHHVGDWRAFLRAAAERLRPGGVFLMQEPFREGYLIMALALDMVLSTAWPDRDRLSAEDEAKVRGCRDSIYFLANSKAEKIGEDKHNFLIDEVATAASDAGFSDTAFYVNAHFDGLPEDLDVRRGACCLSDYLSAFLQHHHRVSYDGMIRMFVHLKPMMALMDEAYVRGDGPALVACVGMRR